MPPAGLQCFVSAYLGRRHIYKVPGSLTDFSEILSHCSLGSSNLGLAK